MRATTLFVAATLFAGCAAEAADLAGGTAEGASEATQSNRVGPISKITVLFREDAARPVACPDSPLLTEFLFRVKAKGRAAYSSQELRSTEREQLCSTFVRAKTAIPTGDGAEATLDLQKMVGRGWPTRCSYYIEPVDALHQDAPEGTGWDYDKERRFGIFTKATHVTPTVSWADGEEGSSWNKALRYGGETPEGLMRDSTNGSGELGNSPTFYIDEEGDAYGSDVVVTYTLQADRVSTKEPCPTSQVLVTDELPL